MIISRKTSELKLNDLQRSMVNQIDRKIKDGTYSMEALICPVCESSLSLKLGEKDRYGLKYHTNICQECGLVYTSPRMTQQSYNDFYNIEYRKLYVGKETATEVFFQRQQAKGQSIFNYLKKQNLLSAPGSNILEVGCGAGGILEFFTKKGYSVKGIDLGVEYINFGKDNYGLDLETGSLKDIDNENKFDLIIYSHVLEHILDLEHELLNLKKFIHANTVIYIEVPGVKSIHLKYDMNILMYLQNAHTFHFTLRSLTNLMSKMGYESTSGNEMIQSTFRLNDKIKPHIESDFNAVLRYIKIIERFRKFYWLAPWKLISIVKIKLYKLLK